jgi:hypothetical protein
MTVTFDLKLNEHQVLNTADSKLASESDLRYLMFNGSVTFLIEDCDFGAPWGPIPALDFAAGMMWIIEELRESPNATFDFTESEKCINFLKSGQDLRVSANYANCVATCSFENFAETTRLFARRVVNEIIEHDPAIEKSKSFVNIVTRMFQANSG